MDQGETKPQSIPPEGKDRSDPPARHGGVAFYEIHVEGHLDNKWSDWLEGLEVELLDNGEMILYGPIVDQAALLGLLNKLGHLNLTLISVNEARRTEREKNECHTK